MWNKNKITMAIKNTHIQTIDHVSTNSSLNYVTLHVTVDGRTQLITMHAALLFAASQEAMAAINYQIEKNLEYGNEG